MSFDFNQVYVDDNSVYMAKISDYSAKINIGCGTGNGLELCPKRHKYLEIKSN